MDNEININIFSIDPIYLYVFMFFMLKYKVIVMK